MRIAYCIQGLFRTGGIERVVSTKANYWVQHGHEVCIITTDQRGHQPAFDLDSRIRLVDLDLNYEADNQLGRFKRLKALYAKRSEHKHRLEKVLREFKPDITVSTFFQDAPILPSIQDGSKKVLELHSSMYRRVFMYPKEQKLMRLLGYYRIWLDKRLAKRYDRFVVLTQEDLGYWGHIPHITAIPNPSPFNIVSQGSKEVRKKVLAVGRYEYEKNFTTLISLWASISPLFPGWELEILGDGPLRPKLQEQVASLGLHDSVKLPHTTSDIMSHYRSSSLVTLLSEYEGLPMVLVEAQTMGLPIVAYACKCGPRDIVTDGLDGYLVSQGNEEVLANRLQELMQDSQLRESMARAALKSSERYSLQSVMALWERLFIALIK